MGFNLNQLIQKLQPKDPETRAEEHQAPPHPPQMGRAGASPQVSRAVPYGQVLPVWTDGQNSDSRLPVRRLPLLRSSQVQDPQQVLEAEPVRTRCLKHNPPPPPQALTSPQRFLWDAAFQNRTVLSEEQLRKEDAGRGAWDGYGRSGYTYTPPTRRTCNAQVSWKRRDVQPLSE